MALQKTISGNISGNHDVVNEGGAKQDLPRTRIGGGSAGRAAKVRPRARITRITVLNSGLPISPRALYRLSRFKSACLGNMAHAARLGHNAKRIAHEACVTGFQSCVM